jgi:AcrR family transcriptional regulator
MSTSEERSVASATVARRAAVLESALVTFGRFGYRKTSMEEVAEAAQISRPGLYFLFASKEELFRAAATRALELDVAEVERILSTPDRPIQDRLLDAFDQWAGRYIGPLASDITAVIEANPGIIGEAVVEMPLRFARLVSGSIAAEGTKAGRDRSLAIAQTLISTAIGIKHQVGDRREYRERLATAIDLLVR